jgi:cysteine-rich repeat protein
MLPLMRPPSLSRALLVLALLSAAPAHAWMTNVAGTPPASRPLAIAVDGAGNVLAAGRVTAAGGDDGLVVKLSGLDGSELWQRTVAGTDANTDQLRAVAHDGSNAVVVAGQATNTDSAGDALVVKYDADGTQAWRMDIDGGAALEDDALAVVVHAGGDVVIAGQTTPSGSTVTQFSVLRRAGGDGTSVWRTDLAGSPGTGRALIATGSDFVAAGDVAGKIVVVKLAGATGGETWRKDVDGSAVAADIGRAVAVGGGRVVVAGRMVTPTGGPDFAVVALDAADGHELWRVVLDGSAVDAADADDAFGVAVDAAGDVIAVGRLSDAVSDDDLVVMKLAGATGVETWRTTVKGGNNNDDDAQAVVLDQDGDAMVVGSVRNQGRGRDFFLGAFTGTTGVEQWRVELNGTEGAADVGSVIALSTAGDPVAGGRLRNGADGDGFTIVKLTGTNGGDFPCANGQTDPGEACDDGNLAAGDGCRADCTAEVCGDGIRDPQEQCDDGNLLDGDCCSATCTAEPDGSTCHDGNACTRNDACLAAVCVSSEVIVCVPESPCHEAACDPVDGTCSSTLKPNGASCDDGNPCTLAERCIGTTCTSSTALDCDDRDACTIDRCDPTIGCVRDQRTGFESVTCVLDRDTIANGCGPAVPRPLQDSIARIRSLVDRAATADRTRKARKGLARAIAVTKRGVRVTAKYLRQDRVNMPCADAITGALNDLTTRATGLRKTLATGS